MKADPPIYYSLLLVLLVHVVVLGSVLLMPAKPQSIELAQPTIQGVIVTPQLPLPTPAALSPVPEQKPLIKPKTLYPEARPSERAVHHQAEPSAVAPVEQKAVEPSVTESSEPLVLPHLDASQINNPAPIYPVISRRLREEGVVVLEILVLVNGIVGELRIKLSSGFPRLDDAAIRAVKNWHFVPAKRGNDAVDFWYELPIEFSLNK